jgi:NADPH-dependent curcumin reductase
MMHRWVLAARPAPDITDATLRYEEAPVPEPAEGEALVRNLYLSLDPTNRGWMNEAATYLPPVPLGDTMRGLTVGRVERSRSDALAEGDLVQGLGGFAEYAVAPAKTWTKLPPGVEPTLALGVLGHIGLTAYFGLHDVGQAKPGETVLVSAAAGATGSLVCQLAKHHGCRVVGVAGGPDKCAYLTRELGIDAAVDYKSGESLGKAIAAASPKGVDVFFDNVGGPVLDAALANLALRGRVVLCGAISQYNAAEVVGPRNYLNLIARRGRIEGFVVLDYLRRANEALAVLVPLVAAGKLRLRLDIVDGLENASRALRRLFDGTNEGKLLIRLTA